MSTLKVNTIQLKTANQLSLPKIAISDISNNGTILTLPKRQCLLSGPVTIEYSSPVHNVIYKANHISVGPGLTAILSASTTSVVATWANGFTSAPYDYIKTITSDATWSSLTAMANNYLYITNDGEGNLTYGSTLYIPIYSTYVSGAECGAVLAHWDGSNGETSYTDNYGNYAIFSEANSSLSTSSPSPKFGTACLKLTGTNGHARMPCPILPDGGWTLEFWFYMNNANGGDQCILGDIVDYKWAVREAANRLYYYFSSNGSSWDIANSVAGTNGSLANTTWYHFCLQWDGVSLRAYIDGTLDFSVTPTAGTKLIQPGYIQHGSHYLSTWFMTGCIDETRFTPWIRYPLNANDGFTVPTNAFTEDNLYWFDTNNYIMYYGNLLVGWTKVYSLFAGEALTGMSAEGIYGNSNPKIGSTTTRCANGYFRYRIGTTNYALAANAAGQTLTATTVPQGKWALFGWEIGTDGTVHSKDAPNNAAGYPSEVAALAALPSPTASHVLFMYITVMKSDGAFVGNTTALNAANVTCNYYSISPQSMETTSVVSYAYQGKYTSPMITLPALNTSVTFNHNIGTRNIKAIIRGRCIASSIYGLVSGDETNVHADEGSIDIEGPHRVRRNTATWTTGNYGTGIVIPKINTGGYSSDALTLWTIILRAERDF